MKYEQYTAKDFAADEDFVKWVKDPDPHIELFWQQWLLQHPEKKLTLEEARQIVHLIDFEDRADTEQRVKAILDRINATTHRLKPVPLPSKNLSLWSSVSGWQKIAASLIGILLISTLIFFFYKSQPLEYRTAFGEKQEIILPDSSRVILNANSRLTVNKGWDSEREVWLEGEAFFSVRKKKTTNGEKGADYLKFTVHTHTMDVDVLGTEFNVSDRRLNTVVVLNSGKIQLKLPNKTENIIMKPGDLVEMEDQKLIKKIVDPKVYNAWTNNEWILNDLTLREVALKIEETYGVKVIINNTDKTAHILAGIVPTDNLDVLLKVLSTTLNIKITQHKDQIIIQ